MFIPHTDADREAMLRTIGVKRLEDLFQVCLPSIASPTWTCRRP